MRVWSTAAFAGIFTQWRVPKKLATTYILNQNCLSLHKLYCGKRGTIHPSDGIYHPSVPPRWNGRQKLLIFTRTNAHEKLMLWETLTSLIIQSLAPRQMSSLEPANPQSLFWSIVETSEQLISPPPAPCAIPTSTWLIKAAGSHSQLLLLQ